MEKPNYYAVLPACVRYDDRLKPAEKLLFAELTSLSQAEGYSWASNGYFSRLYKVSKETVSRWLSHLQECGYIKVSVDQQAGNGRRIIVFDPVLDQGVLAKRSIGIDEKIKTPIDKKINHNNTSINNKKEYIYGFDDFWKAYPKKIAKQDALKAYQKLKADSALLDKLLNALERQKQSPAWKKDGGQYIPHPATWLNGHRWEDEIPKSEETGRWRSLD